MFVVTGLTKMNSGICMSVYDMQRNRYLRPIPPADRFSEEDVRSLELFSVVNPIHDRRRISILAPHTEDYPITSQKLQLLRTLSRNEQIQLLRSISVDSVFDVFGYDANNVRVLQRRGNRNYVLPGAGTQSLGTVRANPVRVYNSFNKIRVDFTDYSGNAFTDISFVSNEIVNPDELTLQLRNCREKYVRLSLARKFRPPINWDFEACFLQVSCVHGF